jgi:hypothetical protein
MKYEMNEGMIGEWRIVQYVEGSGRGLISGAIPAFSWREWGKPLKTRIRTAGLRDEVWTRDLPSMKQQC